jgi:hypothetical protein
MKLTAEDAEIAEVKKKLVPPNLGRADEYLVLKAGR